MKTEEILEGIITEKSDKKIKIKTVKNKEVDIEVDKETIYTEVFLKKDDFTLLKEEEICLKDLTIGDSVIVPKQKNEENSDDIVIKKITVL